MNDLQTNDGAGREKKNVVPDDLTAGDLMVVIGRLDDPPYEVDYSGIPFRIESVSLPFAAVEDCFGNRFAIDLRTWKLGRSTRAYWRRLRGRRCKRPKRSEAETPAAAADDGYKRCVRCGERMAQRLAEPGKWHYHCTKCGSDGGPVPAA